jgi:hypothetical protein
MKRIVVLVLVLGLLVAGCGSKSTTSSSSSGAAGSSQTTPHTRFAKTKFVIHAGLAFGAFHHFIYKPVKAGDFKHPFRHKLEIVKAGLAALFVVHELKIALRDAQSSPLLRRLVSPITALQAKIAGLTGKVKSGSVSTGDLQSADGDIGSIKSQARSRGYDITESIPALP